MLGALIKKYRDERGVTQKEMVGLLKASDWEVGLRTLQVLERKGIEGDDSYEWRMKQVEAVIRVTQYPRYICMFWAGKIPFDYAQLSLDDVSRDDIETGFAMLATAIGKPSLGPRLTPELHERARRQFGMGEPLTDAEVVLKHQTRSLSTVPDDLFAPVDNA